MVRCAKRDKFESNFQILIAMRKRVCKHPSISAQRSVKMEVYMLHSLQTKDDITGFPGISPSRDIKLYTPGNAAVSFHVVLYHEEAYSILGAEISAPEGIRASWYFAENVVFGRECYPDILSRAERWEADRSTYQSVWVDFFAEKNVLPAEYAVPIRLFSSQGEVEVLCRLQVAGIAIPDVRDSHFQTEYWIHAVNSWFRWPDSHSFDCIRHYFGCEKYSEKWWAVNEAMAENMKAARINVLFVRTMDLLFDGGSSVDEKGTADFRWELFDRWVECYLTHGSFQKLAGMHLVMQAEGKQVFVIRRDQGGAPVLGLAPEEGEEAAGWLKQYLSALYEHLVNRGWQEMWLQHVQDEPAKPDSWLRAVAYVRKYMPGIPVLDALDTQAPAPVLQDQLDLWIPRVDIYENNRAFYDFRLAAGDRRWVYTCCLPRERNYANRFLDLPLIHSRVIGWGCFANHFSGFLHWGYDFWDPQGDLFGLNPEAKVKGDGFIIYPDSQRGTICGSVRQLAARDSAQDYELLYLLAKKDPARAYELARRVIRRFDDFTWDAAFFEEIRAEVLSRLEDKYDSKDCQSVG